MKIPYFFPMMLVIVAMSGCSSFRTSHAHAMENQENITHTPIPYPLYDSISKKTEIPHETILPPPKPKITNLWNRIIPKFSTMVDQNNPRIDHYVEWYTKHPYYFQKLLERSRPYLFYIVEEVEKRHIPAEFALVPAVESAFDPFAYSTGLAAGLWQVTPSTGQHYDIVQSWWFNGRRDVISATEMALNYFQDLHMFFKDWELVLAAYNAGRGTIQKAINRNKHHHKATDFWNLHLPKQTENYVPKLLAIAKIIKNADLYHIKINEIPNKPYFQIVDVGSQIELSHAAKLAGITLHEIRALNPGYNFCLTNPSGPHQLILPIEHVRTFKKALAAIPDNEKITWHKHIVHAGETLESISKKFLISVHNIKTINHLKSNTIYKHDIIMIPQSAVNHNQPLSDKQLSIATTQAKDFLVGQKTYHRHHIVKKGESISRIAHKYHVTRRQLLKWNHMKSSVLHPGQKLVVNMTNNHTVQYTYTVQPGDNFWDIAKKCHTNVHQLLIWNHLSADTILKPGQKLIVWDHSNSNHLKIQRPFSNSIIRRVYYTVRKGESVGKIAHKFRIPKTQITFWNNLHNSSLHPGQKLTLFVDVTQAK